MTEQPESKKTVRIACFVPNGVMIRLQKDGPDDGTGMRTIAHDGPGVRLNGMSSHGLGAGMTAPEGLDPGITEVDAEWFDAWTKQHKLDPMLVGEHIRVIKDDPEGEENPTVE